MVIRILLFLAVFPWATLLPPDGAVFSSLSAAPRAAVGGFIFEDGDGDGKAAGPFDRPLSGVEVRLGAPCGTEPLLYRSVISDEEGRYQFLAVGRGCFCIHVLAPEGYLETAPRPCAVRTSWDEGITRHDLGLARPGHIVGVVFEDANGNGIQDANEGGLADVVTHLHRDADGDGNLDAEDALLESTRTEPNEGAFAFLGYLPGRYLLAVIPPPDFTATTPAVQGFLLVTGSAGGELLYYFGLRRTDLPPRISAEPH